MFSVWFLPWPSENSWGRGVKSPTLVSTVTADHFQGTAVKQKRRKNEAGHAPIAAKIEERCSLLYLCQQSKLYYCVSPFPLQLTFFPVAAVQWFRRALMGSSVRPGWVCSLPVRHCRRAATNSTGANCRASGEHGEGRTPWRAECCRGSQTSVLPEGIQECSGGCLLCTGAVILDCNYFVL